MSSLPTLPRLLLQAAPDPLLCATDRLRLRDRAASLPLLSFRRECPRGAVAVAGAVTVAGAAAAAVAPDGCMGGIVPVLARRAQLPVGRRLDSRPWPAASPSPSLPPLFSPSLSSLYTRGVATSPFSSRTGPAAPAGTDGPEGAAG